MPAVDIFTPMMLTMASVMTMSANVAPMTAMLGMKLLKMMSTTMPMKRNATRMAMTICW